MTSRPLLISAILHMGVALLVVFGLPMIGRDLPEEMPIARMEIVQTVLETNLIEGNRVSTAKEEQEATVAKKPPPPPPPMFIREAIYFILSLLLFTNQDH